MIQCSSIMKGLRQTFFLGIDSGSTTVKLVLLDGNYNIIHKSYQRHLSKVREKTAQMLSDLKPVLSGQKVCAVITGSAGLGLSKECGIDFVQEVFATSGAVKEFYPDADSVIELGGEDAKIIFLSGLAEERMNGSCAGGTGAFIDQMATLLGVTADQLDKLSLEHTTLYSIASRCGVFAKTDIQPLINQGARKEDISASILQAVVDQTIGGLAQGRKIEGKVVFLGGPLYFLEGLRNRFTDTLKLDAEHAIFPENADTFVALGAALYAKALKEKSFDEILTAVESSHAGNKAFNSMEPLFESKEQYDAFVKRHSNSDAVFISPDDYTGEAFLGVDAGSTTTKSVLITPDGRILHTFYSSNGGNPVSVMLENLRNIYDICGNSIKIRAAGVTGYGEELLKTAFSLDSGIVETVAHFRAAKFFCPDVDFILDIGGQDIKCFKIKHKAIDSIILNEACSSGCGSFIETFASSMEYSIADFAELGIFAKHPVDLGSRCTVFMNSSVKQAQKEGASTEDISAGLSISVVKNAIYKVIRAPKASDLGKNIVLQGGTSLNNAVLRSFEKELGIDVIRPQIAGLMGAFGAALYAADHAPDKSLIVSPEALKNFSHGLKSTKCGLCGNRCALTINDFGHAKSISGNRCERPLGKKSGTELPNMIKYKYDRLLSLPNITSQKGKIGLPLGLNMYDNLPFWQAFFVNLGYEVVLSDPSTKALYNKGQHTIPSDTVCYPAKLLHGHIESLIDKGARLIFYPCLPYNFNENMGDNHYNCPVVAYYPELLSANVGRLKEVKFMMPYFGLHRKSDFIKIASGYFSSELEVSPREVKKAAEAAYLAYDQWLSDIRAEGQRAISEAREKGKGIIVLAGRPYHMDPEINHGIDTLLNSFELAVITEDAVSHLVSKQSVRVLNQWTYHSRLYNAAKYVGTQKDMQLIQLVSFGCGIDAITTDETRTLLEDADKLYTQLKIDEISNLGAIKIRVRSLIAAISE